MMIQQGDMVLYRLSEVDAEQIGRRRTHSQSIKDRLMDGDWPEGAQAHIGEPPAAGQVFPMVVVHVKDVDTLSGQVLLAGNDVLWVKDAPGYDHTYFMSTGFEHKPGTWRERE